MMYTRRLFISVQVRRLVHMCVVKYLRIRTDKMKLRSVVCLTHTNKKEVHIAGIINSVSGIEHTEPCTYIAWLALTYHRDLHNTCCSTLS